MRGYDASGNPIFEIEEKVTAVTLLHHTFDVSVAWASGSAVMSIDTEDPAPGDAGAQKVKMLKNAFPQDPNGPFLVIDRLDADTDAPSPSAGLLASSSLRPANAFSDWASNTASSVVNEGKSLVNDGKKLVQETGHELARAKCLATLKCGKALFKTAKGAVKLVVSCKGVVMAETAGAECDVATGVETAGVGVAVCETAANVVAAEQLAKCAKSAASDGKGVVQGAESVGDDCHLCQDTN